MEEYIGYLLYLAILLILGIFITAIANKFRFSNILFLVLAGYILKLLGFDFFNEHIILVLSALTLIMIVLETTMDLDINDIIKNFFQELKFSFVYFIISTFIMTLLIFLVYDFSSGQYEAFVLCLLLSIIIYGVDPVIAMEFFHIKNTKVKQMMEIEGMISGPLVVVFSFFIINHLNNSVNSFSFSFLEQFAVFGKEIIFALLIGLAVAYFIYKFLKSFNTSRELSALLIIAIAIAVYVLGEFIGSNGSLTVAIYGLFLRGLTAENLSKVFTSVFAHTLYIIVFILFGIQFFFPDFSFWFKALGLFVFYLIIRFFCVFLLIKNISIREMLFITLNVAKGIEVAIVILILKLNFSDLPGIHLILSIGFVFFIYSYVLATIVNHFSDYFLVPKRSRRHRD